MWRTSGKLEPGGPAVLRPRRGRSPPPRQDSGQADGSRPGTRTGQEDWISWELRGLSVDQSGRWKPRSHQGTQGTLPPGVMGHAPVSFARWSLTGSHSGHWESPLRCGEGGGKVRGTHSSQGPACREGQLTRQPCPDGVQPGDPREGGRPALAILSPPRAGLSAGKPGAAPTTCTCAAGPVLAWC